MLANASGMTALPPNRQKANEAHGGTDHLSSIRIQAAFGRRNERHYHPSAAPAAAEQASDSRMKRRDALRILMAAGALHLLLNPILTSK